MRWGRNARIEAARIKGSIHRTETREDGYYCACGVKLAGLGEIDPLQFAFLDHLATVHGGRPE
jgi:hypothetical protein